MRCAVLSVVLAVAAAVPARAWAESCPTTLKGADAVAGVDGVRRFRFAQATLDRQARYARYWNHGWGWGLLGAAGAHVGVAQLVDDEADRDSLYVGAIKSGLGTFSTFVMMPVKVDRVTASGPTPTCDDVARAERALVAAAKSQRVHWFKHVEGVGVNIAGVLYLGIEHDAWGKAAAGALLGIAVGELRLWSRPEGAIHALHRYRAGDIGSPSAGGVAWTVAPLVAPDLHGATVLIAF